MGSIAGHPAPPLVLLLRVLPPSEEHGGSDHESARGFHQGVGLLRANQPVSGGKSDDGSDGCLECCGLGHFGHLGRAHPTMTDDPRVRLNTPPPLSCDPDWPDEVLPSIVRITDPPL